MVEVFAAEGLATFRGRMANEAAVHQLEELVAMMRAGLGHKGELSQACGSTSHLMWLATTIIGTGRTPCLSGVLTCLVDWHLSDHGAGVQKLDTHWTVNLAVHAQTFSWISTQKPEHL
jgi:hypothetical protein